MHLRSMRGNKAIFIIGLGFRDFTRSVGRNNLGSQGNNIEKTFSHNYVKYFLLKTLKKINFIRNTASFRWCSASQFANQGNFVLSLKRAPAMIGLKLIFHLTVPFQKGLRIDFLD